MQNTYRILEAHKSRPDLEYTLEEALNELVPYNPSAVLTLERGLLHLDGTAFYLQHVGGLITEAPELDYGYMSTGPNIRR